MHEPRLSPTHGYALSPSLQQGQGKGDAILLIAVGCHKHLKRSPSSETRTTTRPSSMASWLVNRSEVSFAAACNPVA